MTRRIRDNIKNKKSGRSEKIELGASIETNRKFNEALIVYDSQNS